MEQFDINTYINGIYDENSNGVSLEYVDDEHIYSIDCLLNWNKKDKDDFINNVICFNNDIVSLSNKDDVNNVIDKYFSNINHYCFSDEILTRSIRLYILNSLNAFKLVIDNELMLIITLLIINIFADASSIRVKKSDTK